MPSVSARGTAIEAVHLLNGGLYPDLHRPQPVQQALLDPEQGPQISAAMNEELLVAALQPTFGGAFDAAADSADIWAGLALHNGQENAHLLIRYIDERFENAERWVGALESTDVPLQFIWGMLDPISGAHIGERIRERLPAGGGGQHLHVAAFQRARQREDVARVVVDHQHGAAGQHLVG